MTSRRKALIRALFISVSGCLPTLAMAQSPTPSPTINVGPSVTTETSSDQLGEIVVTAQKREENLQKVPISITAIGGLALENRGIKNLAGLGNSVPGLQFESNSGVLIPVLRGVGNTANTLGNEASVAVYVDGVYFSRLQSGFFALDDIERVEVLKGPQGTLFGRSASGGVIQIVTKDPSHTTSVNGSIGYGRFNAVDGDLYATTGLSDKVAMDISIAAHRDSGAGNNVTTGRRNDFEDRILARSKLLFTPADGTRLTLIGFYSHSLLSGQGSTYPGTTASTFSPPFVAFDPAASHFSFYDARGDTDTRQLNDTFGASLKIEQELAFANLTSITAYIHDRETGRFDPDYGPRPDFAAYTVPKVRQISQEFQLSALKGSPLNWIVGFYYYNNDSRYDHFEFRSPSGALAATFGPGLNSYAHERSISYAGFAQATYEILPKLRVTGGIRYTHDDVSADGHIDLNLQPPLTVVTPPSASDKVNKVTFRAALDYQLSDRILVYGSFSRGYKTPTFNLVTYNPVPNKPETIDAYEVGIKGDFLDRRLRLNIAGFHYKISDPQVLLFSSLGAFVSNAGGARVNGFEFDGQVALMRGLTGRFAATYLDSKYTDYDGAPTALPNSNTDPTLGPVGGTGPQSPINAKGNRTPLASSISFNAGLDYEIETSHGKILLTGDYSYRSHFFWEPDNFLKQKGYGLLDAQIKYSPNDRYAIRIWGRNLTGKKYVVGAGTQAGYGYPFTPGLPVTYGAAVDFKF